MDENSCELRQLVSEIQRIVHDRALDLAVQRSRDKGAPSASEVRGRALVHELEEVVTILRMLEEVVAGLRETGAKVSRLPVQLSSDSGSAPLGAEHAPLVYRHFDLFAKLRVLLKVLYEWMYHLSELLTMAPVERVLSDGLKGRLQTYCTFRHKLIAHQQYAEVDLMKGILRSPGDFGHAELMLTPFTPPENAERELSALFDQCSDRLSHEERTEQNFYERCRILANSLEKFSDSRRGKIISFMERYGAVSDTPVGIARFLRDFVTEVGPLCRP